MNPWQIPQHPILIVMGILMALCSEGATQSIVPAADGTNTQVTPQGNRLDISGGQQSAGGNNLFHSFQQFNLNAGEIANFLANPQLENILSRIVSGNPSTINGLIEITGGSPNLFLMNPAGIVFGSNARLNVPADFTATTATGIGLAGDTWFRAFGENRYEQLVGNPTSFEFAVDTPGSIFNAGTLGVANHHQLTFLGGTVVNTGTLQAKSGEIRLISVSGNQILRWSPAGYLLSLDLPVEVSVPLTPLSLPELLTSTAVGHATDVRIDEQGNVVLKGSGLAVPAASATTVVAGQVDVSGEFPGKIAIAGNWVGLYDAVLEASGNQGGTVLIGSNILSREANFSGEGLQSDRTFVSQNSTIRADAVENGGKVFIWSQQGTWFAGSISASGEADGSRGGEVEVSSKGNLQFAGHVDVSRGASRSASAHGKWGTLRLDPENIVIANEDANPDSVEEGLPQIFQGEFSGETVTINRRTLESQQAEVILEATNDITVASGVSLEFVPFGGAIRLTADADGNNAGSFAMDTNETIRSRGRNINIEGSQLTLGTIDTSVRTVDGNGSAGDVVLNATNGSISANQIFAWSRWNRGGRVDVSAADSVALALVNTRSLASGNGGDIDISSNATIAVGNLFSSSQLGTGGDIILTATGDILTQNAIAGNISLGDGEVIPSEGTSGDIAFTSTNGSITTANLNAVSVAGNGGNIQLNANSAIATDDVTSASVEATGGTIEITTPGNITTADIDAGSFFFTTAGLVFPGVGSGGDVRLQSSNGSIHTNQIKTVSPTGTGGDIFIDASAGVTTGNLLANGDAGGNIEAITPNTLVTEEINVTGVETNGGEVRLNADGGINVSSIRANGGNAGVGGNVSIQTQEFLQVTDILANQQEGQNISIAAVGGSGDGFVTITHGGGDTEPITPFVVGDGSTNGTVGAIVTGENAIASGSFPGPVTRGNIQIITSEPTPEPEPIPTPTPTPEPEPTPTPTPTPESPISESERLKQRILIEQQGTEQEAPPEETTLQTPPPSQEIGIPTQQEVTASALDLFVNPIEEDFTAEFVRYLNIEPPLTLPGVEEVSATLRTVEKTTGAKPALIYVRFVPPTVPTFANSRSANQLELLLVTAAGEAKRYPIDATREEVLPVAQQLRIDITTPRSRIRGTKQYLQSARQLYQWLVDPLEADLQAREIDNLVFVLDRGLRSLPTAALHDGDRFLVEKYSVGLMPSLALTDTRIVPLEDVKILAMGASEFSQFDPLPAVPLEILSITNPPLDGVRYLNAGFTRKNLENARSLAPYGIVHLATHAEFRSGSIENSFIQLWQDPQSSDAENQDSPSRLRLDELRQLNWDDPPVELLVLSACRTAIGNESAELGFAGLAVQAGVKTAMASLWYVDDAGTLALMREFYQRLPDAAIKAEAMQQAQLEMIAGETRLENGTLSGSFGRIDLPSPLNNLSADLSHPYYWSGFTMVGNPW